MGFLGSNLPRLIKSFFQCTKKEVEFNNKVNSWDMRYYMNLIEKENYAVDHEKIKEYFPVDIVTQGKKTYVVIGFPLVM